MKPKFLLFALFTFLCTISQAKQIDESTARQVGQNFLLLQANSNPTIRNSSVELAYKAESANNHSLSSSKTNTLLYVFNTGSKGFVIVSGDDIITPILAYSNEENFNPDNMPTNVAKWMEAYKTEIRRIIDLNIEPEIKTADEWHNLMSENNGNNIARSTSTVNPLMQTTWNQSPYYNDLCPGGSVTGCVATAMAQIMKYWSYPVTGSGFHSYNHANYGTLSANFGNSTYQWSSMPNNVTSSNNAVATLMYDVGVSVDMSYSPQVSGAWVIENSPAPQACSQYALKTYFGYKTSLSGVERVNYTDVQWLSLLKTELDASRPILYAGFGSGGGHCFVADGYDVNDFIHFNWGWGGAYDGYFHINSLDPSGTGTGGGSGGYNTGHQAVVGIEPPSGTQPLDMALYNFVTPSASTIYYGQSFDITSNIVNNSSVAFSGDYCAAIFDASYNFIDFVQTLTGYSLQSGYAYTNNLVFSSSGLFSMLPGTYYTAIYYRPTGGNWVLVSNNGSYTNVAQIDVINPNDIELNSAMVLTPGTTLTQGQSASVNLNIVNDGTTDFIGEYSVGLYNLDGSWAQTIGTVTESAGLPSGFTYNPPYLTFSNTSITVDPGTYLLAVQHNPNNTGWQLTGSSYYNNPIEITVLAAGIQADMYEVNDVFNQAYNLPVSFTVNNATRNTVGSNCHVTSDNDYYKIILATGYNYTITPRLHDSYNSGNGNTYTLDALFSYSTDAGNSWSDAFDDVVSGNITVNGGGTVYFHVAPYFAGLTGTYLLDMSISRVASIGINENEIAKYFDIYPNPANNLLLVDFNEFDGRVLSIEMFDLKGRLVHSEDVNDQRTRYVVPVVNIADGFYFLKINTDKGILTRKITVAK